VLHPFPTRFFFGLFGAGLLCVALMISPSFVGRFAGHISGALVSFILAAVLVFAVLRAPLAPTTRLVGFLGVALLLLEGGLELAMHFHR
jgi:hypothetical protein